MSIAFRTLAALALALIAISGSGRAFAFEDWQTFVPVDSRFQLEMPAAPTIQSKERGFPPFDFVSTVYTARIGDDAFGLNHTDLPRVAFYFKSEASIFDGARTGFLEDSNASEVSFEPIAYADRDARELIYDIPATEQAPALRGTARMFFDEHRLYIVWAEVTTAVPGDELDRYFGSLRIGAPGESDRAAGRGSRGSP